MKTIRVKNLRCMEDTGVTNIPLITLLVGANSSGKSSFLRMFPLIKQSCEVKTQSGILFNEGDVNMGFFHEALRREASPSEMTIELGGSLEPEVYQGVMYTTYLISPTHAKVALTYAKRSNDSRYPYLKQVKLTVGAWEDPDEIAISSDEQGKVQSFLINGSSLSSDHSSLYLRQGRGMIPILESGSIGDKPVPSAISEMPNEANIFDRSLLELTDGLFHGNTYNERRVAFFRQLKIGSKPDMLRAIKTGSGMDYWAQSVNRWETSDSKFMTLRALLLARCTELILDSVHVAIHKFAKSIYYFQPVRAGVQRDYISRDVQVESVDSSGLNVALVLASLPKQALDRFKSWTQNHFGFQIYPHHVGDGARVSLRMKESQSSSDFNLADMGFGFSQMLPFLVQIWSAFEEPSSRRTIQSWTWRTSVPREFLIVIEQPELHLHPALQARLTDLFVTMIRISREKKIVLRFVLETHSPTIIERFGEHIEAANISADEVQILTFSKEGQAGTTNSTVIRKCIYDNEGILNDWPVGFLSAPLNPVKSPSIEHNTTE